jgi:hypothetical protein
MVKRFKTHREYLQDDPDFPKNYWISIAKKHNFLIWIKNSSRKQPPLFNMESMDRLMEFIESQKNSQFYNEQVARPSDLQNLLIGRQVHYTREELGSFARLGLLTSCQDEIRKSGWNGIWIVAASYKAFVEFHQQCLKELETIKEQRPDMDFNPT